MVRVSVTKWPVASSASAQTTSIEPESMTVVSDGQTQFQLSAQMAECSNIGVAWRGTDFPAGSYSVSNGILDISRAPFTLSATETLDLRCLLPTTTMTKDTSAPVARVTTIRIPTFPNLASADSHPVATVLAIRVP